MHRTLESTDEHSPRLTPARDQCGRPQPDPDGTPAILIGQEFHLHCPDGIGNTKLIGLLSDKQLGVAATGRNWRTVTRLLELSGPQS